MASWDNGKVQEELLQQFFKAAMDEESWRKLWESLPEDEPDNPPVILGASPDPMLAKALTLIENEELITLLKSNPVTFSSKDLRRLIQACHPDKHGGSALSGEVTAWLIRRKG